MRTALLLALAAGLAPGALAQSHPLDRGAYLLGGTVGYVSLGGDLYATPTEDRQSAIAFQPKAEAFIVPRLTLGLFAAFDRLAYEDDARIRVFTIGPKGAYYFGDPAGRLFPFVSLGAGYSSATLEFPDGSEDDGRGFAATLGGGAAVLVSGQLALTGEAFTQLARYGGETFDGANKLGVRLGVAYFLF
jgi:hypothetical protein